MSIPCVLPNATEIDEINSTLSLMSETISNNQAENKKLACIRDSLLPQLISGEIDVSDIDL